MPDTSVLPMVSRCRRSIRIDVPARLSPIRHFEGLGGRHGCRATASSVDIPRADLQFLPKAVAFDFRLRAAACEGAGFTPNGMLFARIRGKHQPRGMRPLHLRTIATLTELEKASWFSRVGVRDTLGAIVLSSWAEAIEHCSSLDWENLCLEACNQYRERLLERDPRSLDTWNERVVSIRPRVEELVRSKAEKFVAEHNLPDVFEDTVQWDILNVCMEAEYADVCPPGFYASQAYWYVNGHFPCGWQGDFPEGTLIVY